MSEAREDTRVGLIGKTIGRYRVTAELGRGGMATVYRGHDPQLGRDVAIKVMHGAFAGRGDLEARFRREARAVASIKHDGIVNVFDFAPAGAGEPGYIVTEIVEGPTLRTVVDCNGGRLLPEIAALVAARIAGALGAAHARGIVHRDVKPDNVMFDLAGGSVRVLLTDFGIARMAEIDTMTVTGAIVGSPIYMSPEQTRGQEIGPASDVFSLGVLLYQVVTGRPPFAGRDPMTAIAAIQRGEFLRPSQVDAHVGPALEAVIMRCLQRLPATRFPDGTAVETALSEIARDVQKTLGLNDGGQVLRRFFDDVPPGEPQTTAATRWAPRGAEGGPRPHPRPGAFIDGLSARVAEQAFEQARAHARRRELARALAETNRVFAYARAHAGAQALLAGIARRRRVGKVMAVGLMLALAAGAGVGGRRWLTARRAASASASASRPALASASASGTPASVAAPAMPAALALGKDSPPVGSARTPVTTEPPVRRELPAARTRPAAPGRTRGSAAKAHAAGPALATRAPAPPARALAPAPAPGPAPTVAPTGAPLPSIADPPRAAGTAPSAAATPASAAAPAAAPGRAPVAAATASLALRASQGFCSPSMDDQPASIHPSYDRVPPGPHRLYCTLPGGTRSFVAEYDLRAGTRPNLVIVPGPNGKPTLSRPE